MAFLVLTLLLALDPLVSGPGVRFELEQSNDGFGMRSHGIVERFRSGKSVYYALPQSTPQDCFRLRPEDVRINPFKPEQYERQEVIGPYQVENGKIWFGKQFYDGEGERGVGAFGYFDTATRMYTLFSPPEVARFEISAILVQSDKVWLGLDHFGEDISTFPGGLIEWQRVTHDIRKYPLEFNIERIRLEGDALRLTTRGGYALLRNGSVRRFLANGKPIDKFPLPPSKQ